MKSPASSEQATIAAAKVEVRFNTDSMRAIRPVLLQLAYSLASEAKATGYLVLVDSTVGKDRLLKEWEALKAVIVPQVLDRLYICLKNNGAYNSIPRELPEETASILEGAIGDGDAPSGARCYYDFVIPKFLLYRYLEGLGPISLGALTKSVGCSRPTLRMHLKRLGSLIEHRTQGVTFRYFPMEEFERLIANSELARNARRYRDGSGSARSVEAHYHRLSKLNLPDVAIGGVGGAKYYDPGLDLVGSPRLDLSVRKPSRPLKNPPQITVRKWSGR